jgi:hypothetical protein
MSHVPAVHTALPFAGTAQATPHAPQFAAFLLRSTQADEQAVEPLGHSVTQCPAEQTSEPEHACAQLPQWFGSVPGSTHSSPQRANPVRHVNPHRPESHSAVPNAGATQTLAHAPQFDASDAVSTHCPPHK